MTNFEIIFITQPPQAEQLYELLLLGSKAVNLNTVLEVAEFWTDFKQSLIESVRQESERNNSVSFSQILQQIDSSVPFCAPYLQACEVYLEQSKRLVKSDASGLLIEEDEDTQQERRGLLCDNFREFLEDTYLQTYMLLCSTYGEQGAMKFHQLILSALQKAGNDAASLEACFFMLKSIEAALKDDQYPCSVLFAQEFFNQILGPQSEPLKHPSSILLKKGFC